MKEIDPNQTGCCREQDDINQTGCCREQDEINQTGCCREQDETSQTGCCREQDETSQTGCCREQEGEVCTDYSSSNRDPVAQLQECLNTANQKYMRLYSEFDNFKKRNAKERLELSQKANEQTLRELLPIVDDFERCVADLHSKHTTTVQEEFDSKHKAMQQATQAGIQCIYDKLRLVLQRFHVQEMTLEVGSTFNPDLHTPMCKQSIEDPNMKGKIISVVEKGYLIHGHVLRFAKVIIGV